MKKQYLMKIIHKNTPYTFKELEEKYQVELNKYPEQAKYYAKKRTMLVLHRWANRVSWGSLEFNKEIWK